MWADWGATLGFALFEKLCVGFSLSVLCGVGLGVAMVHVRGVCVCVCDVVCVM